MLEINLIIKKLSIYIKQIISIPSEFIQKSNLKKYSTVFFISDNASWATDNTTKSIIKFFNKSNIKCVKVFNEPENQYVFFTDQYSILKKKNFSLNKNIIAIDYQHGITKYLINNRKLLNKIKKNQNNIKLIRVTNSFFKNYLIKNGIKKEKIFQIPLTVDTNFFRKKNIKIKLRNKYNLPQNKFLIGSFHKDGNGWDKGYTPKLIKGPDTFIKTLKRLKKTYSKDKFAILLTAPARGYVKKHLKKLNIEYYHKIIDDFKELPNLYNCLDLYLITSRDEGGPTGMFEAMACGIPVVSTKVGHAHDYIKNFKNGFKCKIDDYKSLAHYSLKILLDEKLKKKIINNSIAVARQNNFDNHKKYWKIFLKKFLY